MALSFPGKENPVPWELIKWKYIERFGWTVEYMDALKLKDLHELIQVDDGRAKAR